MISAKNYVMPIELQVLFPIMLYIMCMFYEFTELNVNRSVLFFEEKE